MISLPNLKSLEFLPLGRNKKVSGLEEIGETLRELWISYNLLSIRNGLLSCKKLHTLFMLDNRIKSWGEITKLTQLLELKELLPVGNSIFDDYSKKEVFPVTRWWTRCLRR